MELNNGKEFPLSLTKYATEIEELKAQMSRLHYEHSAMITNASLQREKKELPPDQATFNSRFFSDFTINRVLSEGEFGHVFEVESIFDFSKCAIKRIPIRSDVCTTEKVLGELREVSRLDHPGIIRYNSTWAERPPKHWQEWADEQILFHPSKIDKQIISYPDDCAFIYIQMEMCPSLEKWLGANQKQPSRPLPTMTEWFTDIVTAVTYIHERKMIHRDLKPSNIMFTKEGSLKVSDLGTCEIRAIEDGQFSMKRKSDLYISPEQLSSSECSTKTDIFALGLILAELCVVMTSTEKKHVFDNYRRGLKNSVLNDVPLVDTMVSSLTNVNESNRPECKTILEILPRSKPQSRKRIEKCWQFPQCPLDFRCPYVHPKFPCTQFPNCKRGWECIFLHDICSNDEDCEDPNCAYEHYISQPTYYRQERNAENLRKIASVAPIVRNVAETTAASSMQLRRSTERNASTHFDVRLHAEKAAFEGQTLRTLFNSLQARTMHKLSPETRLFAQVCYEKKLAHCVLTALIECALSEEGREKAIDISKEEDEKNVKMTWEALLDHCSLKWETTNIRLSRLSDHWSKSTHCTRQALRLKEIVQTALYNSLERANKLGDELLDWIELYSVNDEQMKETTFFRKHDSMKSGKTNLVVVDRSDTFSEAEAFLMQEVETDSQIHVIVGNEDDGVRFYKRVYERYSSYGIQLNWREKKYRRNLSPRIVIGSRDYFTAQFSAGKIQVTTSAVILHCEDKLEEPFVKRYEPGNLDEYIEEIFVLTTVTMKHFDEIRELVISGHDYENMFNTINSWPIEKQVLDVNVISNLWNRCHTIYGDQLYRLKFIEELRIYTHNSLEEKIKEFEFPPRMQNHLKENGPKFVQCAINARGAEMGQDYVVYSERSSGELNLKIRLKKQITDGLYGIQQFLELRHGCEMTPYRVPRESRTASKLYQNYDRLLIIQRSNPLRVPPKTLNISQITVRKETENPCHTNLAPDAFPKAIKSEVELAENTLIIVVCSTNKLILDTFSKLKETEGVNVCLCETPLGILNESNKNPTGTLVVCTTSAHFEGWKFVPRTREKLRIYVHHDKFDLSALEVAFDHGTVYEIESFTSDSDCLKQLNVNRGSDSWERPFGKPKWMSSNEYCAPEADLIERFVTHKEVTDLLQAKRLIHKNIRHISVTAKVVNSRLPSRNWESSDSPMDISCQGFVEKSREKIEKMRRILKEVERLLSAHCMQNSIPPRAQIDAIELEAIANRYMINPDDLTSFVRSMRFGNKPVSWSDVRVRISQQFDLIHDADTHWKHVYGRSRSDKAMIALSRECISNATYFLPHLRLNPFPTNYRELILQCSDRNLDECTMYLPEDGLDEDGLLEMDGASIEYTAASFTTDEFDQNCKSTALLNTVVIESASKQNPLFLFPRRCYDKLTRDLFDSGVLICRDYEELDRQMHPYDLIQLTLFAETTRANSIEILLKVESAMIEYGSFEWMEWLAKRLRLYNYHPEIISFYHQSIAEREHCVNDEKLIERLQEALTVRKQEKAKSSVDKLRVDDFVYNTMEALNRGERLVLLSPPSTSSSALQQLTHYIRSRRMPLYSLP